MPHPVKHSVHQRLSRGERATASAAASATANRTQASVSGSSTSSAITTPTADGGAPIAPTASSIASTHQ